MIRYCTAALCAAFVSGCAIDPKDITGLTTAIGNVVGAVSASAALDQQLAEEFVKQSAELEYLSSKTQTCRDNTAARGLNLNSVAPKEIEKKVLERMKLRLAELYIIKSYGEAIKDFVEARDERAAQIAAIGEAVGLATDVANKVPVIAAEAQAVKTAAAVIVKAISNVALRFDNAHIQGEAKRVHPELEKMVARLKRSFRVVNMTTEAYLNAWRECAEEKYIFMRDRTFRVRNAAGRPIDRLRRPVTVPIPANIAELDVGYTAFQTQYRQFLNAMPQIEAKALDAIVKANAALKDTSPSETISSAKDLTTAIDSVLGAYRTLKGLRV